MLGMYRHVPLCTHRRTETVTGHLLLGQLPWGQLLHRTITLYDNYPLPITHQDNSPPPPYDHDPCGTITPKGNYPY